MNKEKALSLLLEADKAYYNEADPLMADHEYDALKSEAKGAFPEDPYFKKVGAKPDEKGPWKIEKHSIPMGSIENIAVECPNTYIKDTLTNTKKWWMRLGCPVLLAQHKVDGLSVNLEYRDYESEQVTDEVGKAYLEKAILRGDGIEGEDIFRNIICMKGISNDAPIEVSNVRGEIIISKADFIQVNKMQVAHGEKEYANCRNAAAGIARGFHNTEYVGFLRIIPFDIVAAVKEYDSFTINKYKKIFDFVETAFIETWEELEKFYKDTLNNRDKIPYDIDGIVVKADEMKIRTGDTELPPWIRAMKFPSEARLFKVDDIRWFVGKTGKVTPVLINNAGVQFQSKVVHKVTLHNYNQFCKHKIAQGDRIFVAIAGDVIPKVEDVKERSGNLPFEAPKECPECSSLLRVDDNFLYCDAEGCPGRVKAIINAHIKEMGIEEVGIELIEKLYQKGQEGIIKFNHFPDLYNLNIQDILKIDGYQEKSASTVIKNIAAKKTVELSTFIASLCIESIGAKTIDKIGAVTLDQLFKMSLDNMKSIDGIGEITAIQIKEGLDKNYHLIGQLFGSGIKIVDRKQVAVESNRLDGKSYAFTGDLKEVDQDTGKSYTREKAWELVAKNGGEVKTGVSKKLNVLVLADMNSGSSKARKAREYGTELISSKEFFKRVGIIA